MSLGHEMIGSIHVNITPNYIGAWKMPGCDVYFNCTKRPSWLHRTMMRMLLGWVWKDNK